jgi:hypothetical protein
LDPPKPAVAMKTSTADSLIHAKSRITEWIDGLRVVGTGLGSQTKKELLEQLAAADPVVCHDGTLELVLPALSSLGVGIFQRSFHVEAIRVRVVPYGIA